jgi:hypothetical protein
MSDFKITGPLIGAQPIDEVSTTQMHPLGTRVRAKDIASTNYGEGEFVYVKGVSSGAVGSVVLLAPDDWTTSLATANDKGKLGVLMAVLDANTKYGWAQIYGKGAAKVLASFADNGDCYLTATAGSVDDADVAGDFIRGMKGASAIDTPSTGLAEVELGYPEVQDGADN